MFKYIMIILLALSMAGNNVGSEQGNNLETVQEMPIVTTCEMKCEYRQEKKQDYQQEQEREQEQAPTIEPEQEQTEEHEQEQEKQAYYYTKMSTVLEVNHYDDSVIVVDEYGEMWEFYGAEDWAVADYCELIFTESGVPGYFWDDAIVGTVYKGVNEQFE